MPYRRILTIQDISCVGQCSMTVALPILSACGHETCILPAAVLSTHTGGFGKPAMTNLTSGMDAIWRHWHRQGITFDAIYTGYLGSVEAVRIVSELTKVLLAPEGILIVDPAMADHGKLYSGFDDSYVQAMTKLCSMADVILPNLTESCLLTNTAYSDHYDEHFIRQLLEKLHQLGAKSIVLTGIGYTPGYTGVVVSQDGQIAHYEHPLLSRSFHGTGDIFAAAFTGCYLSGRSMEESAAIAADFALECIQVTEDDASHWYGTKLHCALPLLAKRLYG